MVLTCTAAFSRQSEAQDAASEKPELRVDATESQTIDGTDSDSGKWIQLFNGKNLDGWTPKIRYHKLGDNFGNTFRVNDGLLQVRYEAASYPEFDEKFGHLFYKTPYSHYRLRVEYRFLGEQCTKGPGWAIRNSGLMLHCEAPEKMSKDQDFPASIEFQILGGDGAKRRTTANLCTPGTNVVMDDKLIRRHCTQSTSKTYHGDQWVTVEVEVRGDKTVKHIIDGEVVLQYDKPQLDPADAHSKELIADRDGKINLASGYISLQSESHPCDFRKVELMVLEP
ncbi:MAG TPA: DUF1080 domain-containing protein [Planctomycetaceae bacterium]|nr:DUF1080 domain-containing protein [Planctomycetaceae bacterium]